MCIRSEYLQGAGTQFRNDLTAYSGINHVGMHLREKVERKM